MRPAPRAPLPSVGRPPGVHDEIWERYVDHTPEEMDDAVARLREHDRWCADLRNLRSEEDEAAEEVRQKASTERFTTERDFYGAWFEETDPKPGPGSSPEERAEWEWRWLAFYYAETKDGRLADHHDDRERFVLRKARSIRRADEWVEDLKASILSHPPHPDEGGAPWPPDDGDATGPWDLIRTMDPEDAAEERALRRVPSVAAAARLKAGHLGWWQSLPRAVYEEAGPPSFPMDQLAFYAGLAEKRGLLPAHVGTHLHDLKRALGHAQDALDGLDAMADAPWMTDRARRRLAALVVEARDATLDRYVEVRAVYASLVEQAAREVVAQEQAERVRKRRVVILWKRVYDRPHWWNTCTDEEMAAWQTTRLAELRAGVHRETFYPPGRPEHRARRWKETAYRRLTLRRARDNRDFFLAHPGRFDR